MNLTISGQHMDTGDALKAHCEEKMYSLKKYFDHVIDVKVVYISPSHHKNEHVAEVSVLANGIALHAVGEGNDFYQATDAAEHKLARQLQKYKGRLTKHRARRQELADKFAALPDLNVTDATIDEVSLEDLSEDLFSAEIPTVKHKAVSKMLPMSVDEAVMQMDLLHKPAFLFQNVQTGKLNVVYREAENQVKWIEPAA